MSKERGDWLSKFTFRKRLAFSDNVACGAVPEALYLSFHSFVRGFRTAAGYWSLVNRQFRH